MDNLYMSIIYDSIRLTSQFFILYITFDVLKLVKCLFHHKHLGECNGILPFQFYASSTLFFGWSCGGCRLKTFFLHTILLLYHNTFVYGIIAQVIHFQHNSNSSRSDVSKQTQSFCVWSYSLPFGILEKKFLYKPYRIEEKLVEMSVRKKRIQQFTPFMCIYLLAMFKAVLF